MNSAKAITKYARISPRKVVGVAKLVRGRNVLVARTILMRTPKKAARLIEKTLDSAIANAKVKNLDHKRLIISDIRADQGPSLKRSVAWSKGSARPIKKRSTHLSLTVTEKEAEVAQAPAVKASVKPARAKKTAKTQEGSAAAPDQAAQETTSPESEVEVPVTADEAVAEVAVPAEEEASVVPEVEVDVQAEAEPEQKDESAA